MHTLTIDGITIKFDDVGTLGIVKAAIEKRDAAIDAAKAEAKKKQDELDGKQAKLDQAEKDLKEAGEKKTDAADVGTAVRSVMDVLTSAQQVVDVDDDFRKELLELKPDQGDDLPAAIRKSVVLKVCADEADAIKAKGSAYFEARFDALVAGAKKADKTQALGKKVIDVKNKSKSEKKVDDMTTDELEDHLDTKLDEIFNVTDPLEHTDAVKDFRTVNPPSKKAS